MHQATLGAATVRGSRDLERDVGSAAPVRVGARLLWAAMLFGAPGRLLRILGARYVLQAQLERHGSHRVVAVGVAVDGLHAASAFAAAVFASRQRPMKLADGGVAAMFACEGGWALRRESSVLHVAC